MIRFVLCFILILLVMERTASRLGSGPHIGDVNILLPPKMTNPVEYRLQGSDGCFKWTWDHHDILSVLPEYNVSSHCSTSARLRSIAAYNGRQETAVYATDVRTGTIIRCKVFIDNFSRIQIFHNSIKLDLEGLATLRVRAFDREENEFSSLVGLQFMWQLIPETDGLSHHLAHVPLKDSPLCDSGGLCDYLDIQIKLEDSGVFSDFFVVKGTGIGHEEVSVHLLEPHAQHMADKIGLTVAEAMSLDPPSPVFVLIGAALQYGLKVIRGSTPQVVTLPSPHHRWSVLNSSVAQVDSLMGISRALSLGVTNVIAEDTRVAGHIQLSSLHVVLPDTLYMYISHLSMSGDPLDDTKAIPSVARWYVVSGHQYLIQMKAFLGGPETQEIYLTEGNDIKLNDNQSAYWETILVSERSVAGRGWQNSRILKATSPGLGKLAATLTYFNGLHDAKETLKVVQELMVCEQIKLSLDITTGTSQTINLPWIPTVYQEMELKATGGCAKASSDYTWFSSDISTVSVSSYGIVQAKKPGKATVKVVSSFDSYNYDEVVIDVSVPSSMVMLRKFPTETVVRSHLQAAVTMKTPVGAYYSRCDAFHSTVKWKTGSDLFVTLNATTDLDNLDNLGDLHLPGSVYGPPCSWTYVYASGIGQTILHATLSKEYYPFGHSINEPIVLKVTSRIAAFPPLVLRQAGDGNHFGGYWFNATQAKVDSDLKSLDMLYLVPGTQLDVTLFGGPEKWDKGVDFIETVEVLNEQHIITKGVDLHHISSSDGNLYTVICQTPGAYDLVFRRGNLVGDDHPLPSIAEVSVSLTCDIPSSVALIVDEPVNKHDVIQSARQADRSLGRIHVTPVTVANGQTIRVAAVGISSSGEAFANSSSLSLMWELSSCDGLVYSKDISNSKRPESAWERFLMLRNESGLCIVRATVTGFGDSFASHYSNLLLESSESALTDAVRLQLVSTLRLNPEFNLLFFNPDAKVNLSINGGSCFLEAVVNDSRVAELIQAPPALRCLQLVLSPKGLGTTLVTVYDIGLTPPLASSALVQVADIDWIKIMSGDEITLKEGNSVYVDLMVGTSDGSTFDSSQFAYMKIHVHIADNIVEVIEVEGSSILNGGYLGVPGFQIRGNHLGVTALHVSAKQHSGHEVLSQAIIIEVYAPPRLHPHDIFLVPGASYVLTVKGGPTIGVNVEYTTMNDDIATVLGSSGRLYATSPGNTTLLATFYGKGDTMICQAYGTVKVAVPSSAMLIPQSDMLAIGSEMPLYPLFPEGDLFSFCELCRNYKWTVEDEKMLSLLAHEHVHGENVQLAELEGGKELAFLSVLKGRSAGKTDVTVSFSCDFVSSGSSSESKTYYASVSITVVPDFPLALGAPMTWVLPPFYTTSSMLPSSFDSHIQSDSSKKKGTITYSLLRNCDNKNEVSMDDISIDENKIKTAESNNAACILAKDWTSGRIDIAACVRVAEVTQVRITNKEFPLRVVDLAVGAELELPVSYCDSLGNPFYEAHNAVIDYAETNYPNVVSLLLTGESNGIIRLKGMQHGRALVRVSISSNTRNADYILISVGAHLHPQNPVIHIGSYLNFSAEGFGDQVSGHWFSANESIVSVEMSSGQAEAVGEGSTQVLFQSPRMKLQTRVTVLPGNIIFVDAPVEMLTNAPFPTKGYRFSVKLRDDRFNALKNDKGVTYNCQVNPSFVGYAKPWIDLSSGNSYCLFFPYSPDHLVRSIPKSKDMRNYISVSVTASLREPDHGSRSASALFIGGFSILEMSEDTMQLNLTPDSNKTIITIVGNTDVEIHWQDRETLMVSPVNREDFGIGGRAQYEVKLLKSKRLKHKIYITLPATGQSVELEVNSETLERDAPRIFLDVPWFKVIVTLTVLLITIIIFTIALIKKPYTLPPPPIINAPVTPIRSSPTISHDQSPRTPQPFVDYLRRTIDETPYYRREGRRFNPQNTF